MSTQRRLIKKSQKQEKRTAKEFSNLREQSRPQIASGAIDGLKGDVKTGINSVGFNDDDFLIENKFTEKASFSIKKSIWEKIEEEALKDNLRIPIMQVDIQDAQLVILSKNDFLSLIDK